MLVTARQLMCSWENQSQLFPEFVKCHVWQVLCKHVCGVIAARKEDYRDFLVFNAFTDIMILNVNVFGMSLLNRIRSNENGTLIVGTNQCFR